MGLFSQRRTQQEEGDAAVFGDLARLLAGELQTDGFQAGMADQVPDLQVLNKNTDININSKKTSLYFLFFSVSKYFTG